MPCLRHWSPCILALGLLTACETRFIADFESDPLGEPPAALPAGMPSDQISISEQEPDSAYPPASVTVEASPPGGSGARSLTIDGGEADTHPDVILDSDQMQTSNQTIIVQWEQAVTGTGSFEVFLFAPGDAESSCHLVTYTGGISLDCESQAETIEITDIDPFEPHLVTVSLLRGTNATGLLVTQNDVAAPQNRDFVNGTPDVADGQRLRAQLTIRGNPNTTVQIDRFEMTEGK